MLFCLENIPEGVAACEKKITVFGEYDVCYENDSERPFLIFCF
jgi:hypothetical protein